MSEQNKFFQASGAYGAAKMAETGDQRSLEAQILLKSATQLEMIANRYKNGEKVKREELNDALEFNRKLWTLFVSDTMNPEHPLPKEIKNNIASLGVYIFKRTMDILIDTTPEKFKILIDINRNIASGLMKQQKNTIKAAKPSAPAKISEKATDQVI